MENANQNSNCSGESSTIGQSLAGGAKSFDKNAESYRQVRSTGMPTPPPPLCPKRLVFRL